MVSFDWSNGKGKKKFTFESFWTTCEGCKDVVKGSWVTNGDDRLDQVENSLDIYRLKLKQCNKEFCPNNAKKIEDLKIKLAAKQNKDVNDDDPNMEDCLVEEINDLWVKEAMYWHQQARSNWLNFGDKNSKFFLLSALQRPE